MVHNVQGTAVHGQASKNNFVNFLVGGITRKNLNKTHTTV